ncbi:MAG: helix-turn-helix domain-containing protein [Chthoniobacteraceae bacterium]
MQTFASMLCLVETLAEKVDRMSEQLEHLCAQNQRSASLQANGKRQREFLTVKEVAEVVGASEKSVRRLQKRGFFKSSSALRTKQIPRSEIERYKAETV